MLTSSFKKKDYELLRQDEATLHLDQSECLQEDNNTKSMLVDENRHQCSIWKTTVNLLNYMEGVGFLALPYAVHRGGITVVIGFFVLPLVMGYTASLLVECLYETNEDGKKIRVRSSYQEIGQNCWAPLKHVINISLSTSVILAGVSYLVLFSSMMYQMFPGVPLTESQWSCIAAAIVLPTVFIEHLSKIAWVSIFALLALIVSAGLCMTYEFQEVHRWDVQSLLFWETQGTFIALGILFFSYSLHIVIIQVEEDMADKSKINVALVSAYCIGTVFKLVFAVAGFLTYTSFTNEVIINNLPPGLLTKIIASLFSASVLITFPIPILVFLRILDESPICKHSKEKIHPKLWFITIRVVVVFFTLGVAVLFPHFALVNSLDGCLACADSILFPGLFHLYFKYKTASRFQVLVDLFLIIFGIAGMGFGLVEIVIALITTALG